MSLKNFALATEPKIAIPATTASTTTNGTAIDLTTFKGNPRDIGFTAMASSLGGGTVTFKIQSSPDNSTWTDVTGGASANVTVNVPVALSVGDARVGRYVRLVAVLAGATSAVFSAFAHGYDLAEEPPAGFVSGTNYVVVGG